MPAVIYLVDASVYIFRAYYSMPPEMQDRDGQAAHALFGFARFLGDLIERARPRYLAVPSTRACRARSATSCIRPTRPTATRRRPTCCTSSAAAASSAGCSAPPSSRAPTTRPTTSSARCTSARRDGMRATVVTRDKDMAQLIREGDVYWNYTDNLQLRHADMEEHFGVAPERFADYLALTGDSVDNIQGVPGVGPKTAGALMKEFASLEELYDNLDAVAALPLRGAAKLPAKLLAHRDTAFLARQLTEIARDMPLDVPREALLRGAPDLAGLTGFFDHHNFGPMLRKQAERLAQLPPGA
jgi:DNA polymerase I